jgi:protein gp37
VGDKTGISWTDATWNPIRGCSRTIAAGAKQSGCGDGTGGGCYAERTAGRFCGTGQPYEGLVRITAKGARWTGVVRMVAEHLADPLRWRKPRRIFVNSMSDLFHESLTNEQIAAVFGVMAACPQHTFQILTKRAARMREWFEWAQQHGDGQDVMRFGPSALLTCAWEACAGEVWGDADDPFDGDLPTAERFGTTWPLPNAWIGVSVENQDAADERIPDLLATPAAVRFLSVEPLLGQVTIPQHDQSMGPSHSPLDWIIIGAESGPGARPADPAWFRSIVEQCRAAGVAVFIKQIVVNGKLRKDVSEFPTDLQIQEFPR